VQHLGKTNNTNTTTEVSGGGKGGFCG
jgi:hypothetical protein